MKTKHKFRVTSNSICYCGIVQLMIAYTILAILAKTNGEIINYASISPELHIDTTNIKNNSQQLPVSIDNVNNGKHSFQIVKEKQVMEDFVSSNSSNKKEDTKYNITVVPIYNFERKKIVFNVTWSKPKDVKILSYKFKLSSNCTYNVFETPIYQNSNLTNIYIPPILNSAEVLPGCDYKIMTTIDTYFETDVISIFYHVPECVGQKCSCRLLTPKFESFTAYEIQPGKLNITWEIMKNPNRSVHQITTKMFEYRLLNTSRKHANPFKKIFSISSNTADNKDYIILNDTRFLVHDKQYELRATFNNSFNCKAYNYTNITVTKYYHINHEIIKKSSWTVWAISISLIFFLLVAGVYLFKRNRLIIKEVILNPSSVNIFRSRRGESDIRNSYFMVPSINKRREVVNVIYIDKEIIDGNVDRYEFPRSGLDLIKKIGSGAFGEVYSATARDINNQPGYTDVAVKTLNESASPEEMDDFLSEIEILKKIGRHHNIVQLLGCCVLKKPYYMIMEYVPCGDLLHYLLNLRETWSRTKNYSSSVFSDFSDGAYITPDTPMYTVKTGERPSLTETEYTTIGSEGTPSPTKLQHNKIECSLSHTELQQFALQIAKGMEHLEKIPIAHRDLAARNILIDEFKTLKISDFGLSRFGPYVNNRTQKLPLRWISFEAIKDHFYDSKGDVWSFAVVLWEIGTLGAFPYEDVSNSMVPGYLATGNRLPRPEICTDELYSLMLKCWELEPQERPSFKELVEMLDVKKTRVYVDFSQLNPLYVFPPSKCIDQKCTFTEGTSVV